MLRSNQELLSKLWEIIKVIMITKLAKFCTNNLNLGTYSNRYVKLIYWKNNKKREKLLFGSYPGCTKRDDNFFS